MNVSNETAIRRFGVDIEKKFRTFNTKVWIVNCVSENSIAEVGDLVIAVTANVLRVGALGLLEFYLERSNNKEYKYCYRFDADKSNTSYYYFSPKEIKNV